MKNFKIILLISLSVVFSQNSFAEIFEIDTVVKTRNESQNIISDSVTLKDLKSTDFFDGKYFRVVHKDTEDLVRIDPFGQDITSLRAASAYHHLTQARKYYQTIGIEQKEILTIRIGIENIWHKKYHFKSVANGKKYNNAHTVMPGQSIKSLSVKKWGKEIWLRSPKPVEVTSDQKDHVKQMIRETIPKSKVIDTDLIVFSLINALLTNDPSDYLKTTGHGILQNYITNESVRLIAPELTSFFIEDEFFLDSALIPEVVMHEYTHFMMSDYIPTNENVALTEGLCDYFTTKITHNEKVAHNLGDQGGLITHRDSEKKVYYHYTYDTHHKVHLGNGTQYVLSMLTLIDEYLSQYEDKDYAAKKIFELRKLITINSSIKEDFPKALLKILPKKYKLGILAILNKTGL